MLQLLGIGSAALALPRNVDALAAEQSVDVRAREDLRSTRLEIFLKSRGIKPAHLARKSGYSRQHLLRLRLGRLLPSLSCIAALTLSARRLTREPVIPLDLFERDAITTAITFCRRTTLEDHEREEIIAAFGRRVGRALLAGDRS
jgi:hypothetical protein